MSRYYEDGTHWAFPQRQVLDACFFQNSGTTLYLFLATCQTGVYNLREKDLILHHGITASFIKG